MPGLAAKPATSEEPRKRVELAQEAVERQQKLVEMGVEAKRIIELGVEDLSSRNLLKLFEIAYKKMAADRDSGSSSSSSSSSDSGKKEEKQ